MKHQPFVSRCSVTGLGEAKRNGETTMSLPNIFGGMSPTLTALVGYALWTFNQ